jgi:cytochrome b involved in lipid metabolism
MSSSKIKKSKFKVLDKDLTMFVTNEYEIDVSQYVEEEPKEHELIVDFDQY